MRTGRYILDPTTKAAIPCDDLDAWGRWFEKADRHVAQTKLNGYRVSTVFLGLDHDFSGNGPAILFETMVFPGDSWGEVYCDRCSTWDEAVAMHEKAVAWVNAGREEDRP